jgi:TPR repeat protein
MWLLGVRTNRARGVAADAPSELAQRDPTKALRFLIRACELGSHHACRNVAIMYKKGDGVPADIDAFNRYKLEAELLAPR